MLASILVSGFASVTRCTRKPSGPDRVVRIVTIGNVALADLELYGAPTSAATGSAASRVCTPG